MFISLVSVAVVVQVLPQQEPAPVDLLLAVVGLVPVVPAQLPHEPELTALAPPVVVRLVVEPEVPVHLQPPVVLSRNGKDFPGTGETNVRAGTEIKLTTEMPSLSLSVKELDSDRRALVGR